VLPGGKTFELQPELACGMIAVRAVQRSNVMETTLPSAHSTAEENAVALPQRSAFGKVAEQEWAPGLLFFLLDVIFWVAIYGSFSFSQARCVLLQRL